MSISSLLFLVFLLFLGLLVLGLVLVSLIFVGYMVWGVTQTQKMAPYVSSFDKDLLVLHDHLTLEKGKSLVDLGCGDGKALRFFVKHFGIIGWWYDLNPVALFFWKFLNLFWYKKTVFLERRNFMSVDLSRFDYIYVYLLPVQMIHIEDWIWKTKKKEAIVIANSFQFAHHESSAVLCSKKWKKSIFLYR